MRPSSSNNDLIRIHYRIDPLCDDNDSAVTLPFLSEPLRSALIRLEIQRGKTVVKQVDHSAFLRAHARWKAAVSGLRKRWFRPERLLHPVHALLSLMKFHRLCCFRCLESSHSQVASFLPYCRLDAMVPENSTSLLRNISDPISQLFLRDIPDIHRRPCCTASFCQHHKNAGSGLSQRGFAASRTSDDRCSPARVWQ